MTPLPPLPQELRREWDRCAAEGEPLALLLVALAQTSTADAEITNHLERAIRVHCARARDRVVPPSAGVFGALPRRRVLPSRPQFPLTQLRQLIHPALKDKTHQRRTD